MTPHGADGGTPPRLGLALVRWIIPAARRRECEGDLVELWHLRHARGRGHARRLFWRDVWSLVVRRRRLSSFAPVASAAPIPIDPAPPARADRLTAGVSSLLQDARCTLRLLRRQPSFVTLIVATIACGLGTSTAIFTICDRVLLEPLPYPEPARIVSLPHAGFSFVNGHMSVSTALAALPVFRGVGLYADGGLNLGDGPEPARLSAAAVSAGFFTALGVPAAIGRTFTAREDVAPDHVAVLSFDTFRAHFASDPRIVGGSIRLNSRTFSVVGVMPRGFEFPGQADVWIPAGADNQISGDAFAPSLVARLAPGASAADAAASLDRLAEDRRRRLAPSTPAAPAASVVSLQQALTGRARPVILFLAGLSWLLLLATCANVAGLLVTRLRGRDREFLVRTAIGATPGRLARQLVTESAVLAALGVLGGVPPAVWMIRVFVAAAPGFVPDIDFATIDVRFFAIVAAVASGCVLLCSLGPVTATLRRRDLQRLREGTTSTTRARSIGHALVAAQMAAALVLLAGTSAALAVVVRLTHVDLGFHNDRAAIFELTLPVARYPNVAAFVDQLDARLSTTPGVVSAGATTYAPDSRAIGVGIPIAAADRPAPPPDTDLERSASLLTATPDYFRAMGIPIVAGRSFRRDDRAGAPRVVILNRTEAGRLWPGDESPVGRHVRATLMGRESVDCEVVGIVPDVRLRGVTGEATPQIYAPLAQMPPYGSVAIAVGATADPVAVLPTVAAALRAIDPELPMYQITLVRDVTARFLASERLTLTIASAFACFALALSALGLYGALSQLVAQRTREIGIRAALGAPRGRLRWQIVAAGARLAALGVVIGALASGAAERLIAHFVPALDAPSFRALALDAVLLMAVALLAAWVPARRASAVDPLVALK